MERRSKFEGFFEKALPSAGPKIELYAGRENDLPSMTKGVRGNFILTTLD